LNQAGTGSRNSKTVHRSGETNDCTQLVRAVRARQTGESALKSNDGFLLQVLNNASHSDMDANVVRNGVQKVAKKQI
jgi:hypothetical protein